MHVKPSVSNDNAIYTPLSLISVPEAC